jgi:hypothetical protein
MFFMKQRRKIAMKCSNCGNEVKDGASFCPACGAQIATPGGAPQGQPMPQGQPVTQGQPISQGQPVPQPVYAYQNPAQDPNLDYTPISMWGYFGYEILFSIPCIGFIMLLVFSFGGTKNINLRNFARSYFCFLILAVILVLIFSAVIGGSIAGALS